MYSYYNIYLIEEILMVGMKLVLQAALNSITNIHLLNVCWCSNTMHWRVHMVSYLIAFLKEFLKPVATIAIRICSINSQAGDGFHVLSGFYRWLWRYSIAIHYSCCVHQDTWSCVMRPSSGVQDTVCYLHKPTFNHFSTVCSTKTTGLILIKITF